MGESSVDSLDCLGESSVDSLYYFQWSLWTLWTVWGKSYVDFF